MNEDRFSDPKPYWALSYNELMALHVEKFALQENKSPGAQRRLVEVERQVDLATNAINSMRPAPRTQTATQQATATATQQRARMGWSLDAEVDRRLGSPAAIAQFDARYAKASASEKDRMVDEVMRRPAPALAGNVEEPAFSEPPKYWEQ